MAAMSTLINGRRAFILDPDLTEIPGELPQGTGGLEFAQAPGSGIGVLKPSQRRWELLPYTHRHHRCASWA